MTTKTAWADLPNARHIDAVIVDSHARSSDWVRAWDAACSVTRPWSRNVAWNLIPRELQTVTQGSVWVAGHAAALDTIRALIAWDSSAELLDLPPDVLRTMIDLAPEPVNHQAALLLPYAIVREGV